MKYNEKISELTKKVLQFLTFTFISAEALFYPFKLKDSWILKAREIFKNLDSGLHFNQKFYNIWDLHLEPFLFFGVSPLILKAVIAELLLIPFVIFFFIFKITSREKHIKVSVSHLLLFLFLIYACFSLVYTPTFDYSLKTVFKMFSFILLFLIISGIPKNEQFVKKSIVLLIILSAILEIVSLGQRFGLTNSFMFTFPAETLGRNSMGSFIGHNTGLGAFIFPVFIMSLSLLLVQKSKIYYYLILAFQILTIFVILAIQSRSAWLNFILLTPLFFIIAAKIYGKKIFSKKLIISIIAAVLMIFISQTIDNPIKVKNPSLIERFQHLTPNKLKSETRLRILVCSIPIIKSNLFLGTGIGSFQYVYPAAQGQYFLDNPNTILVPTQKRTEHAHNDYLQVLIELGLIGFILIILTAIFYFRDGYLAYKNIENPNKKIIQTGILLALISFLLQASLDFPIHIPQLAALFIFIAAIWVDGRNIYNSDSLKIEDKSQQRDNDDTRHFHPLFLYSLLIMLIIIGFIFGAFVYKEQVADIYEMRGESYLNAYVENTTLKAKESLVLLQNSEKYLKAAWRKEPLQGKTLFFLGQVSYLYADMIYEQMRAAKNNGYDGIAEKYRKEGNIILQLKALPNIRESLNEFKNHSSYQLMGLIYELLYRFNPNFERYYSLAKNAYEKSYKINPFFVPTLQSLAEMYLKEMQEIDSGLRPTPKDYSSAKYRQKIYTMRKLIAEHDPKYWENNFINKGMRAMFDRKFDEAIKIFSDILKATPNDQRILFYMMNAYLELGDTVKAEECINMANKIIIEKKKTLKSKAEIKSLELDLKKGALALLIKKNQIKEALEICRELKEQKLPEQDYYESLEVVLLYQNGEDLSAEKAKNRLLSKTNPAIYFQNIGIISYETFKNKATAKNYLEEFLKYEKIPNAKVMLILAEIYFEEGDFGKAKDFVDYILKIAPWHKPTLELNKKIIEATNSNNKIE